MLHGCYLKAAHATMKDDVLGPQQAVHPRGSVGRSVRVSRISKAAAARLQGYGRDTPCSDSKPVCRSMASPAATARLHGYGQDLESSSNAFCAPVCQSATFKAAVATLQPDVQNPSDLGLRARGPPQPAGPPFKRLRTTAGSRYDCNSAIRSTKAVTSRNQTDGQLRFDGLLCRRPRSSCLGLRAEALESFRRPSARSRPSAQRRSEGLRMQEVVPTAELSREKLRGSMRSGERMARGQQSGKLGPRSAFRDISGNE